MSPWRTQQCREIKNLNSNNKSFGKKDRHKNLGKINLFFMDHKYTYKRKTMFQAMKNSYPTTKYQPSLNELTSISIFEEKEKKKSLNFSIFFVKLPKRKLCSNRNLYTL